MGAARDYLTVVDGGPDAVYPTEEKLSNAIGKLLEKVPILARREDIERVVARLREAVPALEAAESVDFGDVCLNGLEEALGEARSALRYAEQLLSQEGDFLVMFWEAVPDYFEEARAANARIGAADFVPARDYSEPLVFN